MMTVDGVKVLLSAIFNFAKTNARPVVCKSTSGGCKLQFGVQIEGYPKAVNVPYMRRHGVMDPITGSGLIDNIERSALGSDVPSVEELMNLIEEQENLWMNGQIQGNSYWIANAIMVTGYTDGVNVTFEYALLPEVSQALKSDYAW